MSPTFICMKGWDYKLPDYLKLKAINNMKNVPPLFFYNQKGIESQDKKCTRSRCGRNVCFC